jgi:hypothetical protein
VRIPPLIGVEVSMLIQPKCWPRLCQSALDVDDIARLQIIECVTKNSKIRCEKPEQSWIKSRVMRKTFATVLSQQRCSRR